MYETLERLVCQDDDDAKIQYSLRFVWLTVQEALSEGPEVIERLADRDGFEAELSPIKRKGHRDMAKKGSWLDTIESSTSIALLTFITSLTMFCV